MTAVPEPAKMTAEAYLSMPNHSGELTELRGGEIVALARPSRQHQRIAYGLHSEIRSYIRAHNGSCDVNGEIDVRLDDANVVVPDVSVVCDPSKLDDHGCNGAPDWVIEVTSTNRENDFDRKLWLYRESGVREYWIVDTDKRKVWVYDFDRHPNVIEFYDWLDEIPVRIYDGKLKIRIADCA